MKIDLREDAENLLTYVRQRVGEFDVGTNEGPGDGDRVHQINFGYSIDQLGMFALVFDTREDADTDGEWNSHLGEETMLELEHWSDAVDLLGEETVTIIDHRGREHRFDDPPNDESIVELVGEMLLGVMSTAKEQQVFEPLPTADVCHLAIEDQLGAWGWPMYEDRGRPETTL